MPELVASPAASVLSAASGTSTASIPSSPYSPLSSSIRKKLAHPRVGRTYSAVLLLGALCSSALCSSCAGTDPEPSEPEPRGADSSEFGDTTTFDNGKDPGTSASSPSLDLSGWGLMSANWCEIPTVNAQSYQTLDKAKFAQLIADYSVGWSNPGYESLLGLDEDALFDSAIELISATFDRQCRERYDEEEFPPVEMLDASYQQDGKDEIIEFLLGATEVETGESLRLAVHECSQCEDEEPLGLEPSYINARLTADGVLVMSVELNESTPNSRTIILSPDALVVQTTLDDVSLWLKDIDSSTRSGKTVLPEAKGTVSLVMIKDNLGAATATLGLSGFGATWQASDSETIRVGSTAACLGMHASFSAARSIATSGLYAGDLKLEVPGSMQCDGSDCGAQELAGVFSYQLGDLTLVAEQPDAASPEDLRIQLSAERASTATVGGSLFASGGPGKNGQGGRLGLQVDNRSDGYLVTFSPPLALGGALAISKFSDQTRLLLPNWLQDEIFDITFGGDPTSSVFVPRRSDCPVDEEGYTQWIDEAITDENGNIIGYDYHLPYDVERREVEVHSGTLTAQVGSGTKTASTGQCLGKTFAAEDSLTLSSDWADVGFACTD